MGYEKNIGTIRIDPIVPSRSVLIYTIRGKRSRKDELPQVKDILEYVESYPFCHGNEHLTTPVIY